MVPLGGGLLSDINNVGQVVGGDNASGHAGLWTPFYDTTPPDTTIASGPPALTNNSSASFAFVSNEAGSTFQCQLDSGVFSACASPKSYSGLSNGSHTFQVRAIDPAGNVDPSPAMWTWMVDTTAPVLSLPGNITVGTAPGVATAVVGYAFSASDNVGVTSSSCAPASGSTFSLGATTVNCMTSDAAGNVANGSFTVTVITPAEAVLNLIAAANGMAGLPPGVAAQLNSFDPSNVSAACGKLTAFINQVNAQTKPPPSKPLTVLQATQLLDAANAIKTSLGC